MSNTTNAACPNKEHCPLFPKFKLDMVLRFWIDTYCDADFATCARFRMGVAGRRPPDTMLPNGKDLNQITGPGKGGDGS